MKTNSFIIAALSAVALSSCQVSLMSAVEQGDVVAVRKAIATGVQPGELNAAASVAYSKGNTAVVDELIKSGAVAAPDSVAHKKIEFQTIWRCSGADYSEGGRPDVSTPFLFSQYWEKASMRNVWVKNASDEGMEAIITEITKKDIVWGDTNEVTIEETERLGLISEVYKIYDYAENRHRLEYKRTGMNTAFLRYDFIHARYSRAYDYRTYYLLNFETPTSGTFKCVERENMQSLSEDCRIGRFCLKDVPLEPKKETKKSSKKKRK